MTVKATTKTRIFMISDTHQGFNRDEMYSDDGAFRPPFPNADVLLHSGDLTMTGQIEEYRGALAMLKAIPAELKLVIAGNHDLSLHKDYYLNSQDAEGNLHAQHLDEEYDPNKAEIAETLWAKEANDAGVTYLTEGLHEFSLSNGAQFTIYSSPWQPEFCNWAFNYPHNEDRWNLPAFIDSDTGYKGEPAVPAPPERDPHPIPESVEVDIVMTHGPPWQHRDKCYDGYEAGCPHLLRALNRVRPRLHCFGHIHEAWGAERIAWMEDRERTFREPSGEGEGVLGETVEWIVSSKTPAMKPSERGVIEARAAYLDVSNASDRPLKVGKETLLVNSSIMTLFYKPGGAGWLVDLELPLKK